MALPHSVRAAFAASAIVLLPVVTTGCPADVVDQACCTQEDFAVGGTITASIGGGAEAQVAVQAVADFAGIAAAAVDELTTACRAIATDLDATQAEKDAEEAKTDRREKLEGYCKLAVRKIAEVKAQVGGALSLEAQPPRCSASVSAKAACQAKCDVSGQCDVKANPPKCTGGKLEIACKGTCTATGGASVSCEGSCGGGCDGECTAQGGVDCQGACEGSCSQRDAQGNCNGTCNGTCKATALGATCNGSCKGQCQGECTAQAGASVKCDGQCTGDFEPLRCEGGTLEGGCQVDAKCDASCNASVQAKAECTPPRVALSLSGQGDVQAFAKLEATLEANLPVVFAFRAKLEGMASFSAQLAANAEGLTDIKVACLPAVFVAAKSAGEDVTASLSASVAVVGAI